MFTKITLILLISTSVINSQIISEELVKRHLYTLSSDLMEGRKAGTEGIEKAAQYIEEEFKRIGLKKFENLETYRQPFIERGLSLFNLIGYLEGRSKKNEFVLISAHYDHLGVKNDGEEDVIFNGANDNASGVTAVLALAEHFSKTNYNERSILFIAFTAEEMGLIGSNYFGKNIDPEKIVAGINIEMIGKESPFGPKTAWITGFDRSNFGKIIQKNLINSNYKVYPDPYINFNLFLGLTMLH
jgi:acetylornithine deacetylase/succinyl-diaminopimelate desuccinylase-like protein